MVYNLRGKRKSVLYMYTFQLHYICISTCFPPTILCFKTKMRMMGERSDLFATSAAPFHPPSIPIRCSPSHHTIKTFHYCDKEILSLQTPFLESSSLLLFEPIFWKYSYTLSSRVQLFLLTFCHHLILHRGLVWQLFLHANLYV